MRRYCSIWWFVLPLVAGIFFNGCTVGPQYAKSPATMPANFGGTNSTTSTNAPVDDWWKTFNDAELNHLVETALKTNYDLQEAFARVRESRIQQALAAADLFPQVDADAGYTHARGSKNVVLPLGGSGSGGSSSSSHSISSHVARQASTPDSSSGSGVPDNAFDNQLNPFGKGGLPGAETDLYQVGFDATWEVDVFGGKRREIEAAHAEWQAAREQQHNLMLTLEAEVARDYFELRGFQERREIARQNLAAEQQILELAHSQAQVGLATEADVARAAAAAAATASLIPPLAAGERNSIHALSVLLAQEPEALRAELEKIRPLPLTPPQVPIGLPSQLLERRPDIRAAEREIAAASARIGNATADLFPKFALVGSAGLDASSPANLFDWESRYFLISPTVTWRIFDAGRILANIHLQQTMTEAARWQYRATVLKALQEVENALVNYATEQERLNQLVTACQQNNLALELARQRYERGLVSFLEVLDAERTVLSSQDTLAQSSISTGLDLVALYKALGGGWK